MKKRILFLFVLFATSVAVLARVKFNGLVYGFDYGIYQPDRIDYSFKTLQIIGVGTCSFQSKQPIRNPEQYFSVEFHTSFKSSMK